MRLLVRTLMCMTKATRRVRNITVRRIGVGIVVGLMCQRWGGIKRLASMMLIRLVMWWLIGVASLILLRLAMCWLIRATALIMIRLAKWSLKRHSRRK